MKQENIPYCLPSIWDDEISEVVKTLKSDWLTMGPKTIEFERLISEYTGAKYTVAVNSCTAALHLSLIASGVGKGDDVITTPFTFAATGNTIIHAGAKPVFVDIKKDTYNIDPEKIVDAITPKTKAIIPVHYAGQPCDMESIIKIAEDYNLLVIEDAAHAIGAEYNGKRIGTIGHATCFSFYATKNMTTGEGGAITTDNGKLADRLRTLRLHGINKDAWNRYSAEGSWYYEIEECGWKYNMTDLQAALGIHQIKKLDEFNNTRKKYANIYNDIFEIIDELIVPYEKPNIKHVYHLYPILLNDFDRNHFINKMAEKGIGCSVHFIPLHLHPFYINKFGFKIGQFPNAEFVYEHEVSLPLYPKMTRNDIEYVANSVVEVVNSAQS